jgi:hypothetical protein
VLINQERFRKRKLFSRMELAKLGKRLNQTSKTSPYPWTVQDCEGLKNSDSRCHLIITLKHFC